MHLLHPRLVIATAAIAFAACLPRATLSQDRNGSVPRTPSLISMRLVSVEDGKRFMDDRQVPPSSITASTGRGTTVPSVDSRFAGVRGSTINGSSMRNTLGHPLPTNRMSPLGTPRADFAIAPQAVNGKRTTTSPALTNARIKSH